ncbi:MAG: polysaccharide biosynthesis tyrosine autokinase [Chloroflexota bacterium]|nr:polysaccharide biosynthesis tyrosine autokinase [Chloroflexota bacterium]
MELRRIGQILWKWLWLIILGAVLAGGTAYVISMRSTPIYRASTQILIQQNSNPAAPQWTDVLTSERLAANYAQLLTTRPILEKVAESVGLPAIDSRIIVDPVRETQLIALHVEDPNPALATAIANEVPQVFIDVNDAQKASRFDSSLEAFDEQISRVERDIQTLQEELIAFDVRESNGEELSFNEMARRISLETSLAQYQASLSDIWRRRDEVSRQSALSGDTVTVVESAIQPTVPVRPRVLLNTALAAALGALLMTAMAFLIEYLDDTIKLPVDASRVTGLPALGSLVRLPNGGERQLIAHTNPKSPFSEAYRTLRTNIQFSSLDKPVETLMVTSASPGEGKSTTIANLAVVIAQTGKRTILVDSDLRRPVLHQVFRVPNAVGVTSALLQPEGSDLSPFLQSTEVENLRLMTSGPQPPNPSELLGSRRMTALVQDLADHADVLVFDSPPTLAVTDAAVLARCMDGVLLVVESAKTREGAVRLAAQELAKVNASVLGVVVNRISSRLAGSHYYYYDYYEEKSEGDDSSSGDGDRQGDLDQGWSSESGKAPAGGFVTSRLRRPGSSVQDV